MPKCNVLKVYYDIPQIIIGWLCLKTYMYVAVAYKIALATCQDLLFVKVGESVTWRIL